ncbi:adenylate/guanylate cyclase domain-containing protein [uncultured Alsobacter sp.]|uniref:adenylate/guanylate cyclase domain-containing protein n=1 Tax=uncultured Alsobacter sp. TaxID=1748258 RepID=UPI0025EF11C7|nr:adenylate/guanylate cyclase domain-containing protein [uncultured Alsobacter sp.]
MSDLHQQVRTAILAADAVGFSRSMSVDELRTVQALAESRRVMDPLIAAHGGRIFSTAGDSVLAAFDDPRSAVRAAVAIQEALAAGDGKARLVYRVGVSYGNAIVDGEDLLGDTVNVAARLEATAPAGGICISGEVHERLATGADAWQDLGLRHLKNLVRPVRIFRRSVAGSAEPDAVARARRPMLAVLPFTSADPNDEYLAEGLADDVTAGLSRFSRLAVLGTASSQAYRGGDLTAAANDLGLDYAVRGSLRRLGDRVRLSVQLVAARSGLTIWAERYDSLVSDMFAAQDQIAATVVGTLAGVVEEEGAQRVARKRTESMEAYDFLLRGMHLARKLDPASATEAHAMFERALLLDPGYPMALSWLALMRLRRWAFEPRDGKEESLLEPARRALALDPHESWCHLVFGQILLYLRRFHEAEEHHRRACELNPFDANVLALRAPMSLFMGDPVEGEAWARRAMQLNPRYPDWYPTNLGLALYLQERWREAGAVYAGVSAPQAGVLAGLAASLAQAGDTEASADVARRLLAMVPGFSAQRFVDGRPFVRDRDRALLRDGLRLAGLPD